MKRTLTAALATLATTGVLLTSSVAHAQKQGEFGQQGQFIISADRLVPFFGFTHWSVDTGNNTSVSGSQSSLSLLYGSTPDANLVVVDSMLITNMFFTVPRVGFDYTIIPNLTIGGDLVVFFSLGGSTSTTIGSSTTTTDSPTTTLFGIEPRAGYILGLSDMFSLWLRGGLSFYTASAKSSAGNGNSTTDSVHQFALDLEPQFVITPIPHLGFTAGLTADIPFAGGTSTETVRGNLTQTTSVSSSIFYLGVTLGMLGYF